MKFSADIRFMYCGPNRRSDWPVAEFEVKLDPEFPEGVERVHPQDVLARMNRLFADRSDNPGEPALPEINDSAQRFGWLMAVLMLRLQRLAGQQVEAVGYIEADDVASCQAFVAYDYPECFKELFPLASQLLDGWLCPEAGTTRQRSAEQDLSERVFATIQRFRGTGTPADSWALARTAAERGIPVMRVDRPPYDPIEGPFRIRPHSLMRFGHGHRQVTMDGTFCVSRSQHLHPMIADRASLFEQLSRSGWVVPEVIRCSSLQRVRRGLRAVDFPVAVRSARRSDHPLPPAPLADLAAIEARAEGILTGSADVLLQPWVFGPVFKLVVAGLHCPLVFKQVEDDLVTVPVGEAPSGLPERIVELADSLGVGFMVATVVVDQNSRNQVQILDLELAPRLDELPAADKQALKACAGYFLDWLFPDPAAARIPIAAITGTNGKTTTCHLTRAIMSETKATVGMAGSDGCMIGNDWVSDYEDGHFIGHTIVLDNPATEIAVLESTRGGAGSVGMGFHRCLIAACLNVTEDHLDDRIGLRTLDEVADLKRTILERSDDAIVLNADDPRCLAMRHHLTEQRLGLVSTTRDFSAVKSLDDQVNVIGVLESIDGQPWLVLYHQGVRYPVMAGADMPLSFANSAAHNLANALHAAVIAFLMGASIEQIAKGLGSLEPDFETFYGRLNFYRELPFDVIMDYAHNPDGLAKLCEFIDRQPISGRKLINLSVGAQNSDDFIRRSSAVTAGHFDHYVCKNFALLYGRKPEDRPRLLKEGLMASGVPEPDITCVADELESIDATFRLARPGDLVVVIGGKRKRLIWDWIRSYQERFAPG